MEKQKVMSFIEETMGMLGLPDKIDENGLVYRIEVYTKRFAYFPRMKQYIFGIVLSRRESTGGKDTCSVGMHGNEISCHDCEWFVDALRDRVMDGIRTLVGNPNARFLVASDLAVC